MHQIDPTCAMPGSSNRTAAAGGAGRDARDGDDDAATTSVGLPLHLTEKILCCISPLASARLATVCKSWAAIVSERLARPFPPHLFVTETVCTPPDNVRTFSFTFDRRAAIVPAPCGSGGGDGTVVVVGGARRLSFSSAAAPAHTHVADLVRRRGAWCVGAMAMRGGRLAFANPTSVFFVNPVTGAPLQWFDGVGSPLNHRAVVAVSGGDCESFLSRDEAGPLFLWRQDVGAAGWSRREVAASRNDIVSAAASCNGHIYVLYWDGLISKFFATRRPPVPMLKVPPPPPPPLSLADHFRGYYSLAPAPPRDTNVGHLLECNGDLLFVRQLLSSKEHHDARFCGHGEFLDTVGFQVYMLDVPARSWTKMEELAGGHALFVSPGSSFAVPAPETVGCRSNCIYFVGERSHCLACHNDGGSTLGVYSMADRRILFQDVISLPGRRTEARWFLPSIA